VFQPNQKPLLYLYGHAQNATLSVSARSYQPTSAIRRVITVQSLYGKDLSQLTPQQGSTAGTCPTKPGLLFCSVRMSSSWRRRLLCGTLRTERSGAGGWMRARSRFWLTFCDRCSCRAGPPATVDVAVLLVVAGGLVWSFWLLAVADGIPSYCNISSPVVRYFAVVPLRSSSHSYCNISSSPVVSEMW
jgi:hypothetical protein